MQAKMTIGTVNVVNYVRKFSLKPQQPSIHFYHWWIRANQRSVTSKNMYLQLTNLFIVNKINGLLNRMDPTLIGSIDRSVFKLPGECGCDLAEYGGDLGAEDG